MVEYICVLFIWSYLHGRSVVKYIGVLNIWSCLHGRSIVEYTGVWHIKSKRTVGFLCVSQKKLILWGSCYYWSLKLTFEISYISRAETKVSVSEYLLDKSEMDPAVPWEPFLIEKHTFAHHLLQVWHQRLDITMVTQELKAMQAAISQLMPTRQLMVELPAVSALYCHIFLLLPFVCIFSQ